jgi:hypothetical protein
MRGVTWRRGFFLAWIVIALSWIGLAGWWEYHTKPWNVILCSRVLPPTTGADAVSVVDTKNFQAWVAEAERDKSSAKVVKKLLACAANAPIPNTLALRVSRIWSSVHDSDSLLFLLVPPVALLFVGLVIGWICVGTGRRRAAP